MKIIPFRIKPSEEPDNYSEIYHFLIKGTNKDPYEVEIEIDTFNDLGLTDTRCTCPDHVYRETECKHIKHCKQILNDFKISIESVDTTNLNQEADIEDSLKKCKASDNKQETLP